MFEDIIKAIANIVIGKNLTEDRIQRMKDKARKSDERRSDMFENK